MNNHLEQIPVKKLVKLKKLSMSSKEIPIPVALKFSLWYDSSESRTFRFTPSEWKDVQAWVHELTEEFLWHLLRDKFNFSKDLLNETIAIKRANGDYIEHLPCHILTALHTQSLFPDIIEPENYAKMIFKKLK